MDEDVYVSMADVVEDEEDVETDWLFIDLREAPVMAALA